MTRVVTALKWAPPFAAGQVRDHRVRWVLNEVGWPYEVRLLDAPTQASDEYRAQHPFGQVPCLTEEGRPPLFESGAIVIDVAMRAGKLIPPDAEGRAQVLEWAFAALNSVEPFLMNVAEVEYFTEDAARRPLVRDAAMVRLTRLQAALAGREWLVGDGFTVADLLMGSVLEIARRLDLLEGLPDLAAYRARCIERPALRRAVEEQRAEIAAPGMADMRYEEASNG